jgi:PKD repeat protein
MHTLPTSPAPCARRGATIGVLALIVVAVMLFTAARSSAAEGSQYQDFGQYGEVTRFGGFDAAWFDEGKYDGAGSNPAETQPKPKEFVDPVGFAVDTNDEGTGTTAIYVLDRVSGAAATAGAQGTEWRLQKLSTTGTLLGTSEFYLSKNEVTGADYSVFTGVVGLAVDDSTGAVYTVLYESTGSGEDTTRQADEILEWSTTPNGSDQLEAPSGATKDTISTPVSGYKAAGVLSNASQLNSTALYEPQGLAQDGTGELAVEADGVERSSGRVGGPAVVEQVSTSGGAESASWSASSLAGVLNASSEDASALAAGISADPGGALNVLLSTHEGNNEGVLDDVELSSSLSDPVVLASADIAPEGAIGAAEYPAAAKVDSPYPTQVQSADGILKTGGAGSASAQVVELSNGLYASDYWDNGAGEGYWEGSIDEGIRLVDPEADGLLTNPLPPASSVFDTLGEATSGANCYIGDEAVKGGANGVQLAAGANGAIWVLTSGKESTLYGSGSDGAYLTGRQVIEFAPGATKTCAGPSGTFTVTKEGGTPQPASSALTVPVDTTVEFDGASIEYPANDGGTPAGIYAFEWAPTLGAATDGGYTTINDELEVSGGTALSPSPTASYTYDTPGVYKVGLKLLGDFGEYDETGTVVVQTPNPPTAAFTAPSEAQTAQTVEFNASASQPANGASIAAYEWKFGDGQSDDTQSASDTHRYSSPGTYTVTLTVRDNDNQHSSSVTRQITVTSATTTTQTTATQTSATQTGVTSTKSLQTTTTTTTSTTKKASSAPLTQAQKLAAALKLCKKDKSKKKRQSCERAAKKKYAPKKPAKKKVKSKK